MNENLTKINSSFVSERINKIRFVEESQAQLEASNFISGSSEIKNNVKFWKLIKNEFADEIENEFIPKAVSKLTIEGEVTGLEKIDRFNFAISSGSSMTIVSINPGKNEMNKLRESASFKNLHKFKTGDSALCMGVSVFDENISTIGEDGKINVISANNQKVITTIDDTDSEIDWE
ncbi:hypothetical protein PVAND_000434 [Polypedilum vanderplanki]|uniref:Uncharacterized protein n=1 Tax=Polypedilum vanderplanki TaxID=319348 RepID=A0A9J6BJT8_POLVA|nr:hypothetical protein PVAND_000434 [Polypedilum vanderplanki]